MDTRPLRTRLNEPLFAEQDTPTGYFARVIANETVMPACSEPRFADYADVDLLALIDAELSTRGSVVIEIRRDLVA